MYKANPALSPRELVLTEVFCITSSLDKLKEISAYSSEGFNSADTVVVLGVGPIGMLRRGGTMLEMGAFVENGEVAISPHRDICSKNIRLVGLTNHPTTGYGPSMKLMEEYRDRYPFEKLVSYEFALADVTEAMRTAISAESMKVVIKPN